MSEPNYRIKTDASVRAAKADPTRQVEYRVEGVRGLALRVSPAGSKAWTLRYRTRDGEQRRQTLGRYPDMSLSGARKAAEITLGEVANGNDPAMERRAAKAAASARRSDTVEALIEGYFEAAGRGRHRPNARPKRVSTTTNERTYFERFIKPRFGKLPIAALTRQDVQRLVDEIDHRSPVSARITRNVIRQAFNFGIFQGVTDRNPAQFASVTVTPSRERVLTDDELRAIWSVLGDPASITGLHLGPGTALALKLAILTLQRGGEVVGIHASEIDREARLWTLSGLRTKNHRLHVVPLSDAAMSVLADAFALNGHEGQWSGFAFPSPRPRSGAQVPIARAAFTRGMLRVRKVTGIVDATPHDFRRTGATMLTSERIGIPRFIVSQVLNQISDTGGAASVTGVYDRNAYLAEKRRALDAWAALLAEIVSGEARATNVVPISEVAR